MRPEERLEFARLAYLRAIALARASSTPASWRRALTASRNLGAAIRDRDGARRQPASGRPWISRPGVGPRARPASAASSAEPAGREPRVRCVPPAAGGAAPRAWTREALAAAAAEIERARALMRKSRRLVSEARALRDEITRLLAAQAAVARR